MDSSVTPSLRRRWALCWSGRIEFHTRVLNNEAMGVSAESVRVKLSVLVIVAEEVNLMEDPRRTLSVANGTVQLGLRAFEIKDGAA